ncbi:MAG: hypothetical protein K2Y39_18645 [Candidatus Obscuribacterales bacterium]|nr:hypothetical protein [Candidatus Obscuribacterales bacterium]
MDTGSAYLIGLLAIVFGILFSLILLQSCDAEPFVYRSFIQSEPASDGLAVSKESEEGDIMLGNSLSCLLIQINVAKKYSSRSPEIAFNALEEAEALAQQSLGQVRQRRRSLESAMK